MLKLKTLLEQEYDPVRIGLSRLTDTQDEEVIVIPHDKITTALSKVGA